MNTPQTVSFYILIGIQAARRGSRCGGGFRLWVIAKALDALGTGKVKREELRAVMLAYGIGDRQWQRWIIEARNHDMVTDYQDRAGEWWVILAGPATVAAGLGLSSVGKKAVMSAADLFGNGWRARVYVAWEHGKQISREQIQKAVNVSRRTQSYRAAQVGAVRTRNYSKSALKADSLKGLQENTNYKAPFVMRDGFIAWRLPDMRTMDHIERISTGRSRKINATIRDLNQKGLSNMRRAFTDGGGAYIRLFNATDAQRRQAERKIAKTDTRINDLYQMAETAKTGAVIWTHYPAGR